MRAFLSIAIAAWLATKVSAAQAFDVPAQAPVDLHGRAETVVEVDESSTPFSWNHTSRSPLARTRVMTSAALATERFGSVYIEGAAMWNKTAAADERAHFLFEQGDYLWARNAGMPMSIRLFANERRYSSFSLSPSLLDDDRVAAHDNHGGARTDGAAGAWSWTALGTLVDEDADRFRRLGYAGVRWRGAAVQAGLSYLIDAAGADTLDQRAVLKGEVLGFYRNLTAVVSFEQSGFDDAAVFVPSTSFDWSGYVGDNFAAALPSDAATFAELRLGDVPVREYGWLEFVHRYRVTGASYAGDLADAPPGRVSSSTGVFFRHSRLALDGRLSLERETRWGALDGRRERLESHARAFLKNGSEVLLRGAVGFREDDRGRRTDENFVHAALRRTMSKVEAGVHAMVVDIDDGEFERRYAVETRINWSANVSLYGRLIAAEESVTRDAVYWRLDLRPIDHALFTFAYGRGYIGDAPYLLEDSDIATAAGVESVYTIGVRGEF